MTHLSLEPEAFRSERDVVIEERRLRTEDDPTGELAEQMDAAIFTAHPYRNPVIGWMEDIRRLTHGDAKDFYQRTYRPSNAILVAVGDFEPGAMMALVRKHFGPLPALPPPAKRPFTEPAQKGERRVTLRRPAELPAVMQAWHAPGLSDADFGALEVIDAILSEGRSARLIQSLVYRQGLATSVTAGYDGINVDPRVFFLYAQVFPGKKVETVEKALLAETSRLRDQLVTEAELAKAKTQIEADWYRAQDSAFYRGMQIGNYAIVGDWRKIDDYLPAVRKVRPADVQRAARRIFTEDNRTTGILIPTRPPKTPSTPPGHGGIR